MYRKFKADKIFTGTGFTKTNDVLITDPEGKVIDIIDVIDAGDNIESFKGLLSPGFINCHCHIELSYLKGLIPQHTGLVNFVQAVMENRNAPYEIKMEAMQNAANELYAGGTVAVGDICNGAESVSLKQNSPLWWHNFIEVSGFINKMAEKRFAVAENVAKEFSVLPFPYSITPHAPYSVSEKLFSLLNESTARGLVSIHNQEEASENDLYKNKSGDFLRLYKNLGIDISGFSPTGKTSFQSWLPYFNKDQNIISVHNTFTSQEDIDIAKNIFFCICIHANLYIENVLPPIDLLIRNKQKIVLGTDSYASNSQLNMLEEMKSIRQNFTIETDVILKWATYNGAKALGILKNYGSFEKGKQPGIVLIDNIENNNFTPASKARRIV